MDCKDCPFSFKNSCFRFCPDAKRAYMKHLAFVFCESFLIMFILTAVLLAILVCSGIIQPPTIM